LILGGRFEGRDELTGESTRGETVIAIRRDDIVGTVDHDGRNTNLIVFKTTTSHGDGTTCFHKKTIGLDLCIVVDIIIVVKVALIKG